MRFDPKSDSDVVRDLLREYFPDFRSAIEGFVLDHQAYAEGLNADWETTVDAWAWMSELFIPEILKPALVKERDDGLMQRISSFFEELLALQRSSIDDLMKARVVDYLLGYRDYWREFRPVAGPLLRKLVNEQERYYRGP